MIMKRIAFALGLSLLVSPRQCSTPPTTKQTPPPGVAVAEADRASLPRAIAALGKEIEVLRAELGAKRAFFALLPDVQIFHNAVRYALEYNEFFDAKQIPIAKNLLALGMQRAKELREGNPSWINATGQVVRGYVSKIDNSCSLTV
jgi:hypothetical protein